MGDSFGVLTRDSLGLSMRAILAGVLLFVAAGCAQPPATSDASTAAEPAATGEAAAAEGTEVPADAATMTEVPAAPEPDPGPPPTEKALAKAERFMISSANPFATEAGRAVLRQGGSAVDAAIAAQMMLNLVEPQSSGIGGGAFMLYYDAASGTTTVYDGRETAPAEATPDMFLNPDGEPKKFFEAVVGGLSVGVPGLLRMLEAAHRDYGRLPWHQLFEPTIELAEKGFPVSERLHRMISEDKYLKRFPATEAYFHDEAGNPRAIGDILANPLFADTLRQIASGGADAFYKGPIARDLVWAVRSAWPNPGRLTETDLSGYEAKTREPVCLLYRAWMVCGMPPPSSGGITTLQILGILQTFELANLEPGSLEAVHLVAEASRLAFADRNTYIADPDFIPVPTEGMLDPGYLALRAQEIAPDAIISPAFPGMPGPSGQTGFAPDTSQGGLSTTHISVVDTDGNAVSMTSSIESAFGSRLMVRGFLLNNQLTDFSFRPEKDGAPIANRVAAGKRPRSSMAPTLVFRGDGKLEMAVGSPGGSRIIGYVAKTLIATLDWDMDIQAAIEMGHFINRNGPTDLEEDTDIARLKSALEALGHEVNIRELTSGLHGIRVTEDGLTGGADTRREGVALGD